LIGFWTVFLQGDVLLETGDFPTKFLLNNDEVNEIFMSCWAGVTSDRFGDGRTVIPYQISINGNADVTVFYLQ